MTFEKKSIIDYWEVDMSVSDTKTGMENVLQWKVVIFEAIEVVEFHIQNKYLIKFWPQLLPKLTFDLDKSQFSTLENIVE